MAKRTVDLTPYTVHGVLAGAYRGKDISARALLRHASQDESYTAVCKTVKADTLCDMVEDGDVTCPVCLQRIAARGLTRKTCE
jgi:hypothetical protein